MSDIVSIFQASLSIFYIDILSFDISIVLIFEQGYQTSDTVRKARMNYYYGLRLRLN